MIKINRPAAPAFLSDPNEKWYKETVRAKEYYKNEVEKAFEFETYNDSRLKDELKKVFVKCAYCETNYAAGYDGDVEHFRPKGKIKEKNPQTPGYYWLANDWDNLFLACQHCNQRRKHILYGDDTLQGYGKLDQFPIDPEAKRVGDPGGNLEEEEKARLLINPCKDQPEEHFAYEKREGVIVPLTERGKASVKVYVLQRPYLVQERKKVLIALFGQIALAKALLQQVNADLANAALRQVLEMALNTVRKFTVQDAPYAGMCRYFVRQFYKENDLI